MRRLLPPSLFRASNLRSISEILVAKPHAHPFPAVDSLLDGLFICDFTHVGIVLYLKLATQMLRPNELLHRG